MTTTINKLNSVIDNLALEEHVDFAVQVRDQLVAPVIIAHTRILSEFIMPALADAALKQRHGLEFPTYAPQDIQQFWENVIIPQPTRECFYGMEREYSRLYSECTHRGLHELSEKSTEFWSEYISYVESDNAIADIICYVLGHCITLNDVALNESISHYDAATKRFNEHRVVAASKIRDVFAEQITMHGNNYIKFRERDIVLKQLYNVVKRPSAAAEDIYDQFTYKL